MSRATNQAPATIGNEEPKDNLPRDENGRRIVSQMTDKCWEILLLNMSEPKLTQAQIAERIGTHQVYVCRVMNSPCYIKEKRGMYQQRIHDRLNSVMMDGADRMERIFTNEESSDAIAVDAFKAVAKAAGVGETGGNGGKGQSGDTNLTISLGVTAEMIAEANARRKKRLFDGEIEDVDGNE